MAIIATHGKRWTGISHDDFIFKGSKKWQLVQIGNAVPCLLGKAIGLAVEYSIKKAKN